jgi:hypothetical protein
VSDDRPAHTTSEPESGRTAWIGLLLLVAAVTFGTFARIQTAFADPNFDRESSVGMLKSDPALLFYMTERIVDAGGGVPGDFRADPRVLYPLETDLAARFTVGQEFVAAWAYLLFGRGLPLHVVCVIVMALSASLGAVGVFGLGLELTRRPVLAGLCAVAFACLPANYRTIGFILVREDFSFPWFLLHLWLAARAVRVGTLRSLLAAALALGIAAATWHATVFFATLEAAAIFLWFLRTGHNPLRVRAAWIVPAALIGLGVCVPVLREKDFVLSPPLLVLYGLTAAGAWSRSTGSRSRLADLGIALGTIGGGLALAWARSRAGGGVGDSSHVFGLVAAKLRHLGRLPADPLQLTPEVRLMWQGPFDTLDLTRWSEGSLYAVGTAVLVLGVWTLGTLRRPAPEETSLKGPLLLLTALSLPVAWLIARTVILPGALLPVVAALAASRTRRGPLLLACGTALLGLLIGVYLSRHRITWYLPPQRQEELARMLEALPRFVPDEEAVAADFMTSTAVLATTGRPILLQPKYEDRLSRERAERFLETLFQGTPDDLRSWLEAHSCRFVLLDRYTLWFLGRYAAGVAPNAAEPPPGSAAATFLGQDEDALRGVPGFRLLYRSPADIVQSDGTPTDFFRLYELTEAH